MGASTASCFPPHGAGSPDTQAPGTGRATTPAAEPTAPAALDDDQRLRYQAEQRGRMGLGRVDILAGTS